MKQLNIKYFRENIKLALPNIKTLLEEELNEKGLKNLQILIQNGIYINLRELGKGNEMLTTYTHVES